jgi:hypothetical protein
LIGYVHKRQWIEQAGAWKASPYTAAPATAELQQTVEDLRLTIPMEHLLTSLTWIVDPRANGDAPLGISDTNAVRYAPNWSPYPVRLVRYDAGACVSASMVYYMGEWHIT